MNKDLKSDAPTFREIYRKHRQVCNTLALFVFICLLIVGWTAYEVWFAPLGSKPLISDYVVGKIIAGAVIAWVLTAIAQKK
jgi:uncharacterized membrane protein (DUF485 family)